MINLDNVKQFDIVKLRSGETHTVSEIHPNQFGILYPYSLCFDGVDNYFTSYTREGLILANATCDSDIVKIIKHNETLNQSIASLSGWGEL